MDLEFIIWGIIFLISIKFKTDTRGKRGTVDKVKTTLIIVVTFYIIYTLLGLVIGYKSSPYSQKINQIIKNIFFVFFLKIEQEYIRTKSLNYYESKLYYIFITIIFSAVNIDYEIFKQSIISSEQMIEYVLSRSIA